MKFYNIIMDKLQENYNQISSWTFSKKDIHTFDEYVVEYNEYNRTRLWVHLVL